MSCHFIYLFWGVQRDLHYHRTSQMALDALKLLDFFGWKEKVHLAGISMGGMISLEMADAEPARFQSLTLTSTTSKRNIPTVSVSK